MKDSPISAQTTIRLAARSNGTKSESGLPLHDSLDEGLDDSKHDLSELRVVRVCARTFFLVIVRYPFPVFQLSWGRQRWMTVEATLLKKRSRSPLLTKF